ncbi:MAG: hypothetical protein E6G37_10700 [Actinobacteria bacterium]|nr:MAG: hypothetical protein E6G37_10700 [Actinomycetota bacterium]
MAHQGQNGDDRSYRCPACSLHHGIHLRQ